MSNAFHQCSSCKSIAERNKKKIYPIEYTQKTSVQLNRRNVSKNKKIVDE